MTISKASRKTLDQIAAIGGSIDCKGNMRSGNALKRRGFVKITKGQYSKKFTITAKGRRWLDKN